MNAEKKAFFVTDGRKTKQENIVKKGKVIVMYELVTKAVVIVMAIMGVIMAIAPKAIVKKSLQESKSVLMIVRILGAIIAVGSVVSFFMLIRVVGF